MMKPATVAVLLIATLLTAASALMAQQTGGAANPCNVRPLKSPLPKYPPKAMQQKIEGEVSLSARVFEGSVDSVQVLGGEPLLADAALEAVRKWSFAHCRHSGRAAGFNTSVTFQFSLPDTVEDISTKAAEAEQAQHASRARLDQAAAEKLLLKKIEPRYPAVVSMAQIYGEVVVRAVVGSDGRVRKVIPLGGHPMLMDPVIAAVRNARFRPYEFANQPVEFETDLRFKFR